MGSTHGEAIIPSASRQQRLNSAVTDATREGSLTHCELKPTSKLNRRSAAKSLISYHFSLNHIS